MATPTHQRVFIIVLAIVMFVGTIGSFAALILANENQAIDTERTEEQQQKMIEEYIAEQRKQNEPLEGYEASKFDPATVTKLDVEVLDEGKGKLLSEDSTITANYFGWQSDGMIFDSTNKKNSDPEPIEFNLGEVIEGWTKGLSGQRVGSTVLLSIPGNMAYGNTDDGSGRPSGPLKFVVQIAELK